MDPYLILNTSPQADDEQIKKAYIEAIRQYLPEHYPAAFELIRKAYDLVETRRKRLVIEIMLPPVEPLTVYFHLLKADKPPIFDDKSLRSLLAESTPHFIKKNLEALAL